MTTADDLGPVTRWLSKNGYDIATSPRGVVIAADETELHVERDSGRWLVHTLWRGQDRGTAFVGATADDVDRFLVLGVANDVRRRRRLPLLRHGLSLSRDGKAVAPPGFVIDGELGRGFFLTEQESGRSWQFASDIEAVRYSHYASTPAADLRTMISSA